MAGIIIPHWRAGAQLTINKVSLIDTTIEYVLNNPVLNNPLSFPVDRLGLPNELYSPGIIWHEDKTYLAYKEPSQSITFMRPDMMIYDPLTGLGSPFAIGAKFGEPDTHPDPQIAVVGNNMYIVQEVVHNRQVRVYKSDPGDFTTYTNNEQFGVTESYPKIYGNANGTSSIVLRNSFDRTKVFNSTTGMETFDSGTDITLIVSPGGKQYRHYSGKPTNGTVGGWHYIVVIARIDEGAFGRWWDKYLLKTPDNGAESWNVFYNYHETFSKDVISTSEITQLELETNYRFIGSTDDTIDIRIPRSCMSPNGKFFSFSHDLTDNLVVVISDTTGFTIKPLTIANVSPPIPQIVPIMACFAYDDDNVDFFIAIDVGGVRKIHLYRTSNSFDSIEFIEDVFPDITRDMLLFNIPQNINDIPAGKEFVIIGSSENQDRSTVSDLFFRKCIR